jgi:cytoskeletal protein RodZ
MPRLAPRITSLGRLFRRGGSQASGDGGNAGPSEDPLQAVGHRLKQAREERGLNLRQLALETRISTPVLEALERGWRDRLPEGTYLRTMLPLIEQHLNLPTGSLDVALPPQSQRAGTADERNGLLKRFTPGSIDVFSSWQGGVLYAGISLGLLYALNLQQRQLAAANLLSLQPIAPLPPAQQNRPVNPGTTLLSLYPDLRPLQQASQGQGLQALNSLQQAISGQTQQGVLELNLSQASAVQLQSTTGERSQLKGAQGQLVLQLEPPLSLRVTPAPKTGEVLWNGTPLAPAGQAAGLYRLPLPAAISAGGAAPSPLAPATAP